MRIIFYYENIVNFHAPLLENNKQYVKQKLRKSRQ